MNYKGIKVGESTIESREYCSVEELVKSLRATRGGKKEEIVKLTRYESETREILVVNGVTLNVSKESLPFKYGDMVFNHTVYTVILPNGAKLYDTSMARIVAKYVEKYVIGNYSYIKLNDVSFLFTEDTPIDLFNKVIARIA